MQFVVVVSFRLVAAADDDMVVLVDISTDDLWQAMSTEEENKMQVICFKNWKILYFIY